MFDALQAESPVTVEKPSIPCRKVKCPKCGADAARLFESWTGHVIEFACSSGKREAEGTLSEGEPCRVGAQCSCGNLWSLRGVRQVSDLDTEVA